MQKVWKILDNYIEDMLTACSNDEVSISTCRSYLAQYIVEANQGDFEELIKKIEARGVEAKLHGWSKSH